MSEPALFDPEPAGEGPAVAAMTAQIQAWQLAGRAVSIVMRRALLDQAHAIDLARVARRATQISGAQRVLIDMLDRFRLIDDAPPPTGDPWEELLSGLAGDDR